MTQKIHIIEEEQERKSLKEQSNQKRNEMRIDKIREEE